MEKLKLSNFLCSGYKEILMQNTENYKSIEYDIYTAARQGNYVECAKLVCNNFADLGHIFKHGQAYTETEFNRLLEVLSDPDTHQIIINKLIDNVVASIKYPIGRERDRCIKEGINPEPKNVQDLPFVYIQNPSKYGEVLKRKVISIKYDVVEYQYDDNNYDYVSIYDATYGSARTIFIGREEEKKNAINSAAQEKRNDVYNTDMYGFTKNLTALKKGSVNKVMSKLISAEDYGIVTRKVFIENLLKDGYVPKTKTETRYKKFKNEYGVMDYDTIKVVVDCLELGNSSYDLNKTEFAYANYLKDNGIF